MPLLVRLMRIWIGASSALNATNKVAANVSVLKAVVTQSSSAIPVMPLLFGNIV